MKYIHWNYIIASYLFNEEHANQDVLLCMSKSDVIEAYRKQTKVRISQNEDPIVIEETEDKIWDDFIIAIREGISKEGSLLKNLARCYHLTINNIYKYKGLDLYLDSEEHYPLYITYLMIFVLPLVEEIEQFDYRGYYVIPNKFYKKNQIFGSSEIKLQFSESISIQVESVKNGLLSAKNEIIIFEDIWKHLADWSMAKKNTLGCYSKKKFDNEFWKFVGFPMAECVVLPRQHNKFRMLFEKADLPVNEILPEKTIEQSLENFGCQIIYNNDKRKWKSAWENFREILKNVFNEEYNRWDGNSRTVNKIKPAGNETEEVIDSGRTFNLYITLIANRFGNGYNIGLEVWTLNNGEAPDELKFNFKDQEFNLTINSLGWGNSSIQLNNLSEYVTKREKIVLNDNSNSIKAVLQPSDIHLFHKISNNKYASKSLYQKGETYLILIHDELRLEDSFKQWLEDNKAVKIETFTLDQYELFKIDEAFTDFNGHAKLITPKEYKITDCNSILICRDGSKSIFSNLFDIYFQIEGINTKHSNVYAKFEDKSKNDIKLNYNDNYQLWQLKINEFSNVFYCDKLFKIIVNKTDEHENDTFIRITESAKYYVVGKHKLPAEYHLNRRNHFGLFDENGCFEGLNLPKQVPQANYFGDLKIEELNPEAIIYCNKDYVLYAISSHQNLNKQDFKEILDSISININYKGPIYHDRILNDYDRMGYVNYDYYKNKHHITVNKPMIALLPLTFETRNIGVMAKTCKDSYYKAILVGARIKELVHQLEKYTLGSDIKIRFEEIKDKFLPQTIVLFSKDKNNFKKLAEKIGCDYSETEYAFNLYSQLANLDDFKKSIENNRITSGGYPDDYTKYKSFECFDYETLQYKAKYSSDLDLVTYNPRTRYQRTILWRKGNQFEIDKYWGHFYMMSELKIKKVIFDESNKLIKIPKKIKFPKIYERVLIMMTERAPWFEGEYKCYYIPDNVYATISKSSQAKDILKKLNQL